MRTLGNRFERLGKRRDHVAGDDVAFRMEEAEPRASAVPAERHLDVVHDARRSCPASASGLDAGSRQVKSRHTYAVAAPPTGRIAATNGKADAKACWGSPGMTGTITANGW